jgi:DNA repair protein RecN (Recombination protein N)
MLVELRIRNFAIIEELSLELVPGLNVISGETGSGKSLVLDAFQLILGARPKASYFRKDTEGWEIEALLSLADIPTDVRELLPEQVRDNEEILLSRTMSSTGRGKVFMNGSLCTVQMLQQISSRMLALCTQGQQLRLHSSEYMLDLLDEYAGIVGAVSVYKQHYRELRKLEGELEKLLGDKERNLMRQAELEFIIHELSELDPEEGMRGKLEEEIQRLRDAEKNAHSVKSTLELLLDERGVFSLLARCRKELSNLSSDISVESLKYLDESVGQLTELERDLGRHHFPDEEAQSELERCQERLSELARLERKYKTDDAGLHLLLERAKNDSSQSDETGKEGLLKDAIHEKREMVSTSAHELRQMRYKAARMFEKSVRKELKDLGMPNVTIELSFQEHEPGERGSESVTFLFAPNPGEEPKPLSEIASGGELSRVMLVIKKVFRDKSGVNILIFDEVDTGVSGAVAQAVGEKMYDISGFSQVICITHLPQVACYADRHFSVFKEVDGRTRSNINTLSGDEQVEELAKMLSGYKVTTAARESARELLASKSEGLVRKAQ